MPENNSENRDPFNGTPVSERDDMEVAFRDEAGTQYYRDLKTGDLFYYDPKTGGRLDA